MIEPHRSAQPRGRGHVCTSMERTARSNILPLLSALVACSASHPGAAEASSTPTPTPVAKPAVVETTSETVEVEPPPPCEGDDACVQAGVAGKEAHDPAQARRMFQAGCDADGVRSCERLASLVGKEDPALTLASSTKACDLGSNGSCFNVAEHYRKTDEPKSVPYYLKACGDGTLPDLVLQLACRNGMLAAHQARMFEDAKTMAERLCTESNTIGCAVLGVLYAKGEGVSVDLLRGSEYLKRACDDGNEEACRNFRATVLPVEGANVSIGSITVNGLSASDLRCRREGGGGLFGGARWIRA